MIIINADAAAKHQDVVHVMEARAGAIRQHHFRNAVAGQVAGRGVTATRHICHHALRFEKTWWATADHAGGCWKPLSWLYGLVVRIRADLYRRGVFKRSHPGVAVVVVGNVVVGGAGKTPVVQAIVRCLQKAGYRPGIISRGYPVSPRRRARRERTVDGG